MLVFPNAKINIGLRVTEKRQDGYHNLETIFYPVKIHDALELIEASPTASKDISFTHSGLHIEGEESNNLVIKAYSLLKKKFPELPKVIAHLHKVIPMGAGLGGGSSDAAFMLKLINEKYLLGINQETLCEYALQLGSDCPFFIKSTPAYAEGRGEKLYEVPLSLEGYKILIVYPGILVKTSLAFSSIKPAPSQTKLTEEVKKPLIEWKNTIINDFEIPVFLQYPELANLKKMLYDQGAVFASMSGSGSTIYGIFPSNKMINLKFPDSYFYQWV
jgi:4-diphosphocytidyl-2-C-methyl-D-erythritol kinase